MFEAFRTDTHPLEDIVNRLPPIHGLSYSSELGIWTACIPTYFCSRGIVRDFSIAKYGFRGAWLMGVTYIYSSIIGHLLADDRNDCRMANCEAGRLHVYEMKSNFCSSLEQTYRIFNVSDNGFNINEVCANSSDSESMGVNPTPRACKYHLGKGWTRNNHTQPRAICNSSSPRVITGLSTAIGATAEYGATLVPPKMEPLDSTQHVYPDDVMNVDPACVGSQADRVNNMHMQDKMGELVSALSKEIPAASRNSKNPFLASFARQDKDKTSEFQRILKDFDPNESNLCVDETARKSNPLTRSDLETSDLHEDTRILLATGMCKATVDSSAEGKQECTVHVAPQECADTPQHLQDPKTVAEKLKPWHPNVFWIPSISRWRTLYFDEHGVRHTKTFTPAVFGGVEAAYVAAVGFKKMIDDMEGKTTLAKIRRQWCGIDGEFVQGTQKRQKLEDPSTTNMRSTTNPTGELVSFVSKVGVDAPLLGSNRLNSPIPVDWSL